MKKFSAWIFILSFCLLPKNSKALDGAYAGVQLGHVALTGDTTATLSNAIGFGGYVGVKTSGLMGASFHFQLSSHAGGNGLTVYAPFLSADFLLTRLSDLEIMLGAGPGLYLLQSATSSSQFGLHAGAAADVVLDEHLRLGLCFRYHKFLDTSALVSGFANTQARLSYEF